MVLPRLRYALAWYGLLQWHKQPVGLLYPGTETFSSYHARSVLVSKGQSRPIHDTLPV